MAGLNDQSNQKQEGTGTFSTVLDKVSFVKKIPLLAKATSNDETPTPGYMYQEINKLSLTSGSYCQALLDYLVDRLDKDSYHVKLKVLRILHFVVQYGHPDFRHGLRRRARGIKEATKFSGTPDPLHGNVPFQMVRKAAQDLSSQLFDVAENDTDVPKPQTPAMKSSGGMGSTSSGGGRLEGFGNSPNVPPKSLGDSLVSSLRGFADRVVDYSRNPQATLEQPASQHFGSYCPAQLELDPPDSLASDVTKENVSHLMGTKPKVFVATRKVKSHRPGVAGGGWEDEEEEEEQAVPRLISKKSSQSKSLSAEQSGSDFADGNTVDSAIVEENSAEEELVLEIMTGDSPIPQRSHVKDFMKRCCTLNCDKVVAVLNEQLLKSGLPQVMRGLICMEAFLRCDTVNLDYLASTCRPALAHLFSSSHAPARSKSRKIIRLLEKLVQNPAILEGILPALSPSNSPLPLINRMHTIGPKEPVNNSQGFQLSPEEEDPTWNQLRIPFANSSTSLQNGSGEIVSLQSCSSEQRTEKDKLVSSSHSLPHNDHQIQNNARTIPNS